MFNHSTTGDLLLKPQPTFRQQDRITYGSCERIHQEKRGILQEHPRLLHQSQQKLRGASDIQASRLAHGTLTDNKFRSKFICYW